MNCIKHLKTALIIGGVTVGSGLSRAQQTQDNRPKNVLLILVDDLKPNLGCYGDKVAVSPNIDRLAANGIRFNMAYCNQAVSMASRYNLLTGARSTSTGLYNFGSEFRDAYPDAITLPQYFMNAGYHTEASGKVFHVGHGNTDDKASWSIPHHKEKVIEYLLPESTGRQLTREEAFFENTSLFFSDLPPNRELPRGAAWESPDVLDEAYGDGRLATHAISRLRELNKNPEQPFFMALGFARPHLPFCAPKKYWDMYDPEEFPMPEYEKDPENAPEMAIKRGGEIDQFKPIPAGRHVFPDSLTRKLIHGYYASMSYMDAQLGRVIDELKRLNMFENTIIVLWGDHGWHLGDHGYWTKHTNYEQANTIPLIMVSHGVTKPGSSTNQLAETVDIYPTLTELAGLGKPVAPQPIDGISMVPVLKNPDKKIRDHAYHAFPHGGYIGRAIRTERYRLVEWKNRDDAGDVIYELYDYRLDPLETKNVAQEQPKVVNEIKKILARHPEAKRQYRK
ncbi:MAG: sulfatase [Bacteroidia bacterium]|nr:sulfatase [Bacteroidia bacterium]